MRSLLPAIFALSPAFIKSRQITDRSKLKGVIMKMEIPIGHWNMNIPPSIASCAFFHLRSPEHMNNLMKKRTLVLYEDIHRGLLHFRDCRNYIIRLYSYFCNSQGTNRISTIAIYVSIIERKNFPKIF